MSNRRSPSSERARARPEQAIAARQRASLDKLAAVNKVVGLLGRSGLPVTATAVHRLAGVSRSFVYENEEARTLVLAARDRSQAESHRRAEVLTGQQEVSWRERALNAEDHARELRQEVASQRHLVSDLTGQLREPDGTWIERDRNRLREANELLLGERNTLLKERNELQRRLDGARANLSRVNARRVTELFPNGPGKATS